MRAGTIARVYAETLFRSADRHGEVEAVDESVRGLSAVLSASPEFRRFLAAPQVDAAHKQKLVAGALEQRLHPLVLRFLELVIGKHRERLLDEIVAAWNGLLDARANRQSATVTTAVAADPETVARVHAALEKATGKTIALEQRVDPALLGGLVIRTGDTVIDGSLRSRLSTLRGKLRAAGRAHAGQERVTQRSEETR
jgi:F-type H+-transporting ATPase subunit delta